MTTKKPSNSGNSNDFEKEVYDALRMHGFDMTKSDEEIHSFIENFGETKVEIPEPFANADNLFDCMNSAVKESNQDTFACAAQGQSLPSLPDDIMDKMKSDVVSGKRVKRKKSTNGGAKKKTN